jgi:hypothetical protein
MSDNDPDGIENATHNTFAKLSLLFKCIVGCIFNSIVVILDCKCIVGCIFNSIVFIITREIPV